MTPTAFGKMGRLPIVGVMGSGRQPHDHLAHPLGRWLAGNRFHLLTGGGGGVMAAVSKAFYLTPGRLGRVIGIIPGQRDGEGYRPLSGYPNPWVEIPIMTHLPFSGVKGTELLSRNHINILSADVVVALPGSAGTVSEMQLAQRYGRPLIAFLDRTDRLPETLADVQIAHDIATVKSFVLRAMKKTG